MKKYIKQKLLIRRFLKFCERRVEEVGFGTTSQQGEHLINIDEGSYLLFRRRYHFVANYLEHFVILGVLGPNNDDSETHLFVGKDTVRIYNKINKLYKKKDAESRAQIINSIITPEPQIHIDPTF